MLQRSTADGASPLSQGRELKFVLAAPAVVHGESPLSQGRELKCAYAEFIRLIGQVAPLAGARIEIGHGPGHGATGTSPLSQGRELK